ncbi:hypothetical protein TPENAI_60868 [Tenacibaculum litopenaei]|uniref:hypothetical protein n=1 Tax=Tenacibaculum litopenaei TaxID=396016 RepID=UPI0038953B4F
MKPSKKQKIAIVSAILVLIVFVSCSDKSIIPEPEKLVSEMTKSELLFGVFIITMITGLITN